MELTAEHVNMLNTEMIGWLTTMRGGQPQSSPIGFVWAGGSVWVRSEPQQLKVDNIAAHRSVSFHLDQRGRHVVTMEGQATRVDKFPDHVRAAYNIKYEPLATAAGNSIAEQEALFSACLRIEPSRIRCW